MPHLEWYYKPAPKRDPLYQLLVRTTDVPEHTLLWAQRIAAIASTRLAAHHKNNVDDPRPDSSISVSRGSVDAFVNLDDPDGGALPIAWFLGIFSPYAFGGKGPQPKAPSGWYKDVVEGKSKKSKKKLSKGYGKRK